MRRKLVVGNWKMHGSHSVIARLLTDFKKVLPPSLKVDIAVCPPFVYLSSTQPVLGDAIALGAQNVSTESKGAFTGEVAASMLQDCSCTYVIVGHSERRKLFNEASAVVAEKAAVCLAHDLTPIVCVGESQAERESGNALDVIGAQLSAVFARLDASDLTRVVIAYEPVWAIGTGLTATPQQAQDVHAFIRTRLAEQGAAVADTVKILYGGSVKADNAAALFAQPDIDGGLVGGASLNAEEFAAICKAAE
ncbi:MAG: triosephosphate isomerase [Verrucomicrobiaceae bacterium]|nr:triosephosphate isomerase [Verrucomicrobiaceae bacterium]